MYQSKTPILAFGVGHKQLHPGNSYDEIFLFFTDQKLVQEGDPCCLGAKTSPSFSLDQYGAKLKHLCSSVEGNRIHFLY